jgi:hypothetical protein
MMKRFALGASLGAVALFAVPAWACSLVPMPPPRPGESDHAYKARVAEEQRQQAAIWLRDRQADALQRADSIFIARETGWTPPYRPPPAPKARPGQPPPFVPLPTPAAIDFPPPSYFKPIDWFRGAQTRRLLRVNRSDTTCGPLSIGDTTFSEQGNLYVFFARKGPLSEKTLIDAIAVERINDPALMGFVAKYRAKPAPTPRG